MHGLDASFIDFSGMHVSNHNVPFGGTFGSSSLEDFYWIVPPFTTGIRNVNVRTTKHSSQSGSFLRSEDSLFYTGFSQFTRYKVSYVHRDRCATYPNPNPKSLSEDRVTRWMLSSKRRARQQCFQKHHHQQSSFSNSYDVNNKRCIRIR